MSNSKLEATFYGSSPAVVLLSILYDVLCHECSWESKGNPFTDRDAAVSAMDAHRCGDVA